MKTCFKCGQAKPLDGFYRHSEMADGHLNKCKDCTKVDMRRHRATTPAVKERDRARASEPKRAALRHRVTAAWRRAHPDRARAHHMAQRACASQRPVLCEGCGRDARLEMHHFDYSQPTNVMWLCKACHVVADKIRRRQEAAAGLTGPTEAR